MNARHLRYQGAHLEVLNAVKDGRLVRPACCDSCAVEADVEGHHPDYSKPLEVEWLCKLCHSRRHASKGSDRGDTMGTRLARARQARGLTQLALANRTRLAVGTVSSIENDRRASPRLYLVQRLAAELGVTVDHLAEPLIRQSRRSVGVAS